MLSASPGELPEVNSRYASSLAPRTNVRDGASLPVGVPAVPVATALGMIGAGGAEIILKITSSGQHVPGHS